MRSGWQNGNKEEEKRETKLRNPIHRNSNSPVDSTALILEGASNRYWSSLQGRSEEYGNRSIRSRPQYGLYSGSKNRRSGQPDGRTGGLLH